MAGERADLVALLRVARIDAEVSRLQRSLQEIVCLLDRQRTDLAALGALVEADGARVSAVKGSGGELARSRWERLHRNERTYAGLARAFEEDQADALKLSAELQRKTVEFGEEREGLLAGVSPPLPGLYDAALREGRRPTLASAREGACSACGARLEPDAGRLLRDACRIVSCSGCGRLLYDAGWVERDFMPTTLPLVRKVRP